MFRKISLKNIALISAAMFFILDLFLKNLALDGVFNTPVKVIGNLFKISFVPNYYIAFSLPVSGFWLNIAISFIVLGLLIWLIWLILSKKCAKILIYPLTILILGAISNLVDRWRFGYVIDYLDLKYFTVFNLADVLIVSAIAWLIWIINFKKNIK